jgi:hypothetical protein
MIYLIIDSVAIYMHFKVSTSINNQTIFLFFPRPACKATGRGQGATIHGEQATSENWRGCRDKNKTRLSLSSGLLYSGDVYSSTDYLDTNC